ncbi:MAG: GNAT family N-acetyltransferase [Chloroflexota bacterium]
MQITTCRTPESFLARTQAMLEQHEAVNNLMLGLAETIIRTPDRYLAWYLFTVDDEAEIYIAALWTVPLNIIIHVANPNPQAITLLARHLHDNYHKKAVAVPGVTGRVESVVAFADAWTALVGGTWQVKLHMRVYELRQVIPPVGIEGRLVQATSDHQAMIAEWIHAFHREALHSSMTLEEAAQIANRHIAQRDLYLWLVGDEPVSMAAQNRQTRHGAVIGLVYTPPEQRGHGYASAVVAGASQIALESGKAFCTLFTDLNNPTSNSIYQKIGYYPLEDFDEIHFAP